MSYGCMNGRIRALPVIGPEISSTITIAPCTFPNGLITLHKVLPVDKETSNNAVPFTSLGIMEIHRSIGEAIVDHCWTILKRQDTDKEKEGQSHSGKILILAKLTRKRGQIITSSRERDVHYDANTTTLHIQWRDVDKDEIRRDTIDDTFPYKKTMALPFVASSIVMNDTLLVIGSSTGAIFYKLGHLMRAHNIEEESRLLHDSCAKFKLLKNFMIHAMDISNEYFAVASGERVGMWRVDNICKCLDSNTLTCVADWSATLDGQSRITCVRISLSFEKGRWAGRPFLAFTRWDGSAVLFQREHDCEKWNRFTKWVHAGVDTHARTTENIEQDECPLWEQAKAGQDQTCPCFAEVIHLESVDCLFLAVTIPAVCALRIYDLNNNCWEDIVMSDATERKF